MRSETHTEGKWCSDLRCSKCYAADTWQRLRLEQLERELAAARQREVELASEAAEDVESWGAYASEYFQEKHGLADDVKKWRDRALAGAQNAPSAPAADTVMQQVKSDAPVMKAWNNYKAGDDFQNTRRWALHESHVNGSLWAAFYAGYFACAVDQQSGVREGMLRAAGICKEWEGKLSQGAGYAIRTAREAITRAAEQINAEGGNNGKV